MSMQPVGEVSRLGFRANGISASMQRNLSNNKASVISASAPVFLTMVSAPRLEENANMSAAIVDNEFVTTIQVSKV